MNNECRTYRVVCSKSTTDLQEIVSSPKYFIRLQLSRKKEIEKYYGIAGAPTKIEDDMCQCNKSLSVQNCNKPNS